MTAFTAEDRALIIKLAKKIEATSNELTLLKKSLATKKVKDAGKTFAGLPIVVNMFEATFANDVNWTAAEKEYALSALYTALTDMCKETKIISLTANLQIPKE